MVCGWAGGREVGDSMKVPSYALLDASIGYDLGQVVLLGVDVRLNECDP